ncbi:MAG: FtsW/RodA/SpoVE family cell cycle protein [Planctomycetota bacterium]|jgi:rod shape determining protein RodA
MNAIRIKEILQKLNWWLILVVAAIASTGLLLITSATMDGDEFSDQPRKQLMFFAMATICGAGLILIPYPRIMRWSWALYVITVLGLLGLPLFGSVINGAQRWYFVAGFGIQPAEFAKLAVILSLATWLRFRSKSDTLEGLFIPVLITALPVSLVFIQPDLGSSLVFWPVLLAMCYAAGTSGRSLVLLMGAGMALLLLAYFTVLQDYQLERVQVWLQHWLWDAQAVAEDEEVREHLRGAAYQPWQSLIAIGGGGVSGFGYTSGPQNRFEFLPYRSVDYIFSVACEEFGFLGAMTLLLLELMLVLMIFGVAARSRERYGRLIAVGIGTYLGVQFLLHVAVCAWLVPATGLPMPLVSYGGSSTLVAMMGIALVLNVGARREPVLAADGFA